MLTTIARFAVARPWPVLVGTLLVALLCGVFGGSAQAALKSGGFASADVEAANRFIQRHFPGASPNVVVLVTDSESIDSPAAQAATRRVLDLLRARADVTSIQAWSDSETGPSRSLRSVDGRSGLILVGLAGDDTAQQDSAGRVSEQVSGSADGVTIRTGGAAAEFHDISTEIADGLLVAEAIALPVTLLLLILVFGSVVAAALPVVIGLFSIISTLAILRALTLVTDVSIFALNMTTALGLALAIDYSLFIVSRYREELAQGAAVKDAVVKAIRTAGRTVVFSALTVALSLAALSCFDAYFLRSFAYAGIAVVVAATAASVLVLPAGLMVLGPRVNALDLRVPLLRLIRRAPAPAPAPERTRWYRLVVAVMKRAVPVSITATAVLVLLGLPFLSVQLAYPDYRVMPEAAPSYQVGESLRHDFDANLAATVSIALPDHQRPVGDYAAALSAVAGVTAVLSPEGVYSQGRQVDSSHLPMTAPAGTVLAVRTGIDPMSQQGAELVAALRAVPSPVTPLFGGTAPVYKDALDEMYDRLPIALAIVVLSSLVLLFLFTGSLVLPVKALLLNLLSLTATYGAMVWVFQQGHLSGLLGFTATGYLNANMPPLMFCLAFGMSMDYEVFLLSRIREEWLASDRSAGANTHAVAMGVARTGRIFTAAAALMAVVFLAIATSAVSSMQMFGIGLALAVVADATIIRLCLAPALMRLMSTGNWWLPGPLAALHRRVGLTEHDGESGAVESIDEFDSRLLLSEPIRMVQIGATNSLPGDGRISCHLRIPMDKN
ncbi:MMPL family transporter [Nocardia sp. 2]|uniref:MMPL family transporter n=1 Tax=Nocardia acididurans TaxID=2802282 RepID=A0ABS1MDF9_9NOCA|nr:MMPL family transporter [Nocardia acididurans]MBL1078321.1 MMPL family transporter [Nocardia acididurans]